MLLMIVIVPSPQPLPLRSLALQDDLVRLQEPSVLLSIWKVYFSSRNVSV